ncbi:MAG: hypothetical protein H0W40_13150 [Methylibium sp.]|uniref:transporter associated domain-containing protein n=1 Tax=Methylibium sp. TaxID=2067992 RepID=UPI0017D5EB7C|nr:transporter associated domain-containing protein [Methylibium sp.]MBA3598302.1 hypothetical protein [Methylibium sp.]
MIRPALIVPESGAVLDLIGKLRKAPGQMALISDEYGTLHGLVTPIDVFEAIAGEFPDDDEPAAIQPLGDGRWQIEGGADLHQVERELETSGLVDEREDYTSLAGFLLARFGRLPTIEEAVKHDRFEFRVAALAGHRIASVTVTAQWPELS